MTDENATAWGPDPVLEGYGYLTLDLVEPPLVIGEPEDGVVAAGLIRRDVPSRPRAVLYLHGWSDYFFQTWMADFFDAEGYDFYALELRRYGRGLGAGQFGGYTTDLSEYFEELDLALQQLRRDHDQVTIIAHSTGGLVASLWANERPDALNGLILNSPWLDLHGSPMLRLAAGALAKNLGRGAAVAARTLPLPESDIYMRSIHSSLDGEWDFDLALKRNEAFTVRPGWLAAVLKGHEQIRKGLTITTPVLSMMSTRSDFHRTWRPEHLEVDTVLDVDNLARRSVQLGRHVTVVRIEGGLHDLVLSRREVREHVFDQISRWMHAWL